MIRLRASVSIVAVDRSKEVNKQNEVRYKIEHEANVEASENFVDDPGKHVEARSLTELYVFTLVNDVRMVFQHLLQLIIAERLEVQLGKFDDDPDCDEIC